MASNGTEVVPNVLPPIPPNIASLAAPVLIGTLVLWAFWGMLVVQVYIYSILFRDKLLIRFFVYSVFVIDTVQTLMTASDAYFWFASGFGDLRHLGNVHYSSIDVPVLGGLIAILGQTFLCYRLYVLGKSPWLPLVLLAVCFMSMVGAWYNGIRGYLLAAGISTAQATIDVRALYVWLIGAVIGDTGIAIAMTFVLLRARGAHQRSDAILNRLVVLTMETNSVSACLAILSLILYFAAPGTSYFLCPTYVLGKCYGNALLVTLNNRHFLQLGQNNQFGSNMLGSAFQPLSAQTRSRIAPDYGGSSTLRSNVDEYRPNAGVKITTFKTTTADELGNMELDAFESRGNKASHY